MVDAVAIDDQKKGKPVMQVHSFCDELTYVLSNSSWLKLIFHTQSDSNLEAIACTIRFDKKKDSAGMVYCSNNRRNCLLRVSCIP